jgi:hypothetical protein
LGGYSVGAPAELIVRHVKITKEETPDMNDSKPSIKPGIEPQSSKPPNTKPERTGPADAESQGSRTPAIAGLTIAIVLLVVGLWLARELTAASKMQDCLMSGRTNCNTIQPQ